MSGAAMGAGMALNFLGSIMQGIAANRAAQEMEDVYTDYLHRANRYGKEATKIYEESIPGRSRAQTEADIATGARRRVEGYAEAAQTPMSMDTGTGPTALDRKAANMAGVQRAAIGGYTDWGISQAIRDIRTQQQLNEVSSFAGGMARVMPYEMQDAQNSQAALKFHAGLMQALGGGVSAFGAWNQSTKPQVGAQGGPGTPTNISGSLFNQPVGLNYNR